jgi:hypothetical protein
MSIERFKIPGCILLAVSALFFPFWLTAIIFILGAYFFARFYFGLVVLLCMDVIYGFQTLHVGPFYGALTIFGLIAYVAIAVIKERTFSLRR